jgi:hypothetical protein
MRTRPTSKFPDLKQDHQDHHISSDLNLNTKDSSHSVGTEIGRPSSVA